LPCSSEASNSPRGGRAARKCDMMCKLCDLACAVTSAARRAYEEHPRARPSPPRGRALANELVAPPALAMEHQAARALQVLVTKWDRSPIRHPTRRLGCVREGRHPTRALPLIKARRPSSTSPRYACIAGHLDVLLSITMPAVRAPAATSCWDEFHVKHEHQGASNAAKVGGLVSMRRAGGRQIVNKSQH
jgi:hypothetical protein